MYIFYSNVNCWPVRHRSNILHVMNPGVPRLNGAIKKQIIMTIKLTAVLVFVTIMQVSANTYAQKVTLKQRDISIRQGVKEIKKQTGYDVFYLPEMLDASQTIDAGFKDTPVEQVMNKVLE